MARPSTAFGNISLDLTHEVGHSKIYVDTAGLKSSLPPGFSDRVRRCAAYASLSASLRNGVEIVGLGQEDLKSIDIAATDEGFKLFKVLFTELKHLFLSSNQYGLDANLSQRIRHGTLSGEIRAQFEAFHLVTEKGSSGEYLENSYWLGRIHVPDDHRRPLAITALQNLSRGVDDVVHSVRNSWVQIRGPGKPMGMFDYDFSDESLRPLYAQMLTIPSIDTFADFIFDSLWNRTEQDLENIRTAVTQELQRLLFELLDRCQRDLTQILDFDQLVDFRHDITSCKTQIEYGLESLAEWFRVDRTQRMPPFLLSTLATALLNQVTKYCGPFRLRVTPHFDHDRQLAGRFFRPLWDLLFILFDNIAIRVRCDSFASLSSPNSLVGIYLPVGHTRADSRLPFSISQI